MHERIAAIHPGVAAAMSHVDTSAGAAPGADPQRDPHPAQARCGRAVRVGAPLNFFGSCEPQRSTRRPSPGLAGPLAQSRCLRLRRSPPSTLAVAVLVGAPTPRRRVAPATASGSAAPARRRLSPPGSARGSLRRRPRRGAAAGHPADQQQAEVDEPDQREREEDEQEATPSAIPSEPQKRVSRPVRIAQRQV